MVPMEATFHKGNCLQYIYAMILAKLFCQPFKLLVLIYLIVLVSHGVGLCDIGILYKGHVYITPRSLKVKMVRII